MYPLSWLSTANTDNHDTKENVGTDPTKKPQPGMYVKYCTVCIDKILLCRLHCSTCYSNMKLSFNFRNSESNTK